MVRISFHPAATRELESSIDWYAKRSPVAARDYCVAIDLAINKISADPKRFALVDSRHRCCSVQKFPFQVVFRHDADRIHVIAVAHAKRRPNYWTSR